LVTTPPRDNLLLASLSPQTRRALERDLMPFQLSLQAVLREGRSPAPVLFPLSGVISVVIRTNDGQSLDNALIGREGVSALAGLADNISGLVQAGGQALGLSRDAFDRHMDNRDFRAAIDSFHRRLIAACCQSAVCHAFHSAEQRLARWLLDLQDRCQTDEMHVTQDILASMLGVHRPTVTIAARILQAAGMIQYRYGRVTITHREALEEAACECYRMLA